MIGIRNYNDTRNELKIAQNRLDYLNGKKDTLYSKYCSITSKLKEVVVQSTGNSKDKITDYLHELHKIDPKSGKSLAQEIEEQQNEVNILSYYVNLMEYNLSKMKGIEYQLYYEIVVNNRSITNAVDYVASENLKKDIKPNDTTTIWKNYYSKIEKEIKKVKTPVKSQ